MDLGLQLSQAERDKIREQAREEIEAEDRVAAEGEKAVEADAEVADLSDAKLADSDMGAEAVTEDGLPEGEMHDDEGYESGEEEDGAKALAVAEEGDVEAGSLNSGSINALDDAPIGDGWISPDSSDGEITGSGPSTPLDSPLASIDEHPEDEGFVEGDDDSIAENKITPQGSTDEIQTDPELDGSQDELLPSDDDRLSADERDEKERKIARKVVKLELKAMREEAFAKMKEGGGEDVPAEGEDDLPNSPDGVSTSDQTPPTSSVPTPPASMTSTEDANGDAVSTSDPTPPVSPIPSPEVSTASTDDPGPFAPQETDRRVLRNSAAKRVIAALFPDDQHSDSEIAAYDADKLIAAAAEAVEQRRFPSADAKKAKALADAYGDSMDVNARFMVELGYACADVAAASWETKPPGSIKERIVKQMEVNGTSVTGEQPAQSI